jgi:hypothetical protein
MHSNSLAAPPQREIRIDLELQCEPYLQEVLEKPAQVDKLTWTDAFIDRPATPPYLPPKTGIDIETQIEDGELFHFDFEVQPIVSTIVGKILEQAHMEVHEEEEFANIRRHKEAIEHRRNVELADIQRLEEAERRKFEEKQKRVEECLKFENEQRELRNRIAARGFGEFFASDLMVDALALLNKRGYFYDEVEREVETTFLPWLSQAMADGKDLHKLTNAIERTVRQRTTEYEEKLRDGTAQEIDAKGEAERVDRMKWLRRVLVEDIAAGKMRTALKGREKAKKSTEEEDSSEGRSED